jgi:hypothetical protein
VWNSFCEIIAQNELFFLASIFLILEQISFTNRAPKIIAVSPHSFKIHLTVEGDWKKTHSGGSSLCQRNECYPRMFYSVSSNYMYYFVSTFENHTFKLLEFEPRLVKCTAFISENCGRVGFWSTLPKKPNNFSVFFFCFLFLFW